MSAPSKTTRALVTGAAGFIGSRLCIRLVADGVAVVALDDLSDGSLDNLSEVPEVEFVEADLRNAAAVAAAARGCGVIYHQGAKRSVPRSMAEPALTTEVNVNGTLNVLEAARQVGARVVGASSSSVYGDQDEYPLRESHELHPRSPYAVSKLAGELYGASWHRAFGVESMWLRYFNVYGPGQSPHSQYAAVVPLFILAALSGERPTIYGDGTQSRDFTYIDDVIEANLLAARAGANAVGRAYNIGGGAEPTSVLSVLAEVASATGTDPQPIFEPPRAGDVDRTQADIGLAASMFGYGPQIGMQEGLRRTVAWFSSEAA